jgi:PAS domain S-box-containing protein
MHPIRTIRNFVRDLGPVEQAQVVASTSVVVSMATIVSAMAAIGQTPRLMDFISVLTVGLFGFTTVYFSLRYGRQLEAQRRHLFALNAIAEAVNQVVDLPAALESALQKVTEVLGTPHGWIYMLKDGDPVLTCTRGELGDFLSLQGVPPPSIAAWARTSRVCRERLREAHGGIAPALKELGIQFWASIPLSVHGSLAGTLIVAGPRLDPNPSAQAELMQAFGNQISVALTNAHLFEQIRNSQAQYADLFENAPDIYLSVGADGRILDCNATGARMLGATKEELVGLPCESVFAVDRREAVHELLDRLLRGVEVLHNTEETMTSRAGQSFPVYLNSSLVVDVQGKTVNARIVARNITERKKMEAAMLHAQKIDSIGNLAGGIAHDFNNLLTAVLGSASIMRKNLTARSKLLKYVDIVESSARRGSSLTRQLLTFARKTERQVSAVDIHALIQDTVLLFQRSVARSIEVELALCPESAAVSGDEGQLQQAILNLLLNARDALPDGGVIHLATEIMMADGRSVSTFASVKPGPFVAVRVIDSGRGIPREIQGRVFEPFFTTKDQGTGLGLSVVYGVVQSHGGFLNLESAPGCGTTVTMYLPRVTASPELPVRRRKRIPHGTETILIVDDEESVAEIARDMLTALGYTVYVEHNGQAGLQFYRTRCDTIDLILLDVNMPVMGGKQALAEFRAIKPACRVIIVTGYGRETVETSSFPDRINAFMQKPFLRETLALNVRRVLDEG